MLQLGSPKTLGSSLGCPKDHFWGSKAKLCAFHLQAQKLRVETSETPAKLLRCSGEGGGGPGPAWGCGLFVWLGFSGKSPRVLMPISRASEISFCHNDVATQRL